MFLPAILNVWYTQEALSVGNPMFRTLGSRFESWSGSLFYLKGWNFKVKIVINAAFLAYFHGKMPKNSAFPPAKSIIHDIFVPRPKRPIYNFSAVNLTVQDIEHA